MKKKHNYEVIVGNVGTMPYAVAKLAKECYDTYVTISKKGEGRAANEPVTLLKDGEIIEEYQPNLIAAKFNIDIIKEQIANCPVGEIVLLCPNWSINKPDYGDSDPEHEDWDFTEFQDQLNTVLLVTDYNDLVADPHGVYNS